MDYLPYCPECGGETKGYLNRWNEHIVKCKVCRYVCKKEYVRGFWHGVIRANKEGLKDPTITTERG